MGFDLKPRHKSAAAFGMGAFSWSWMLENGVGLPVGYGPGFAPASFIYRTRPDGKCLGYNDGARVTSSEAKQMARVALWLADYHDDFFAQWETLSAEEQKRMSDSPGRIYNLPIRRDFIAKVRAFAAWAPTSGGFRVF